VTENPRRWWKRPLIGGLLGAAAGYAFYVLYGCDSG